MFLFPTANNKGLTGCTSTDGNTGNGFAARCYHLPVCTYFVIVRLQLTWISVKEITWLVVTVQYLGHRDFRISLRLLRPKYVKCMKITHMGPAMSVCTPVSLSAYEAGHVFEYRDSHIGLDTHDWPAMSVRPFVWSYRAGDGYDLTAVNCTIEHLSFLQQITPARLAWPR
jgi:hypothetical protein